MAIAAIRNEYEGRFFPKTNSKFAPKNDAFQVRFISKLPDGALVRKLKIKNVSESRVVSESGSDQTSRGPLRTQVLCLLVSGTVLP